ncbi:hypothetical protein HMI56_005058 [Coelomomyces lativittatus]|nr:hypothetical protein HMI56_005058 [Coelomomyces lativittatus]
MAPLLSKVVDETTYFAFLSKFCFSLENTLLSDALASILPLSSSFFNVKPIHPALVYKLHQMVLNLLGSLELSFKSQKVQFPIVPKHSKEPIFCMKSFLSQFLKGPRDDLENFLFDLNLEEKLEAPNTSSADSVEVPFSTLLSLWGANIDSVLAQSLFNFWKLFIINAPYNWVEWFLLGPGKSLVLERASFISFPNPAIAQTIQCEIGLILYAKYTFHSTLTRCKAFLISDQFKLFSKSD